MIKKLFAVLAVLSSMNFYAQIEFEKAYFIDNNDIKTECFIRNLDWKNNPLKFEFKKSETEAASSTKDINEIKEFSIENSHRYIRYEVSIDTSGVNLSEYSNDFKPEWARKNLFLKEIIQGEYSLYEYAEGNMKRYFFTSKNNEIEQLVYKKYVNKEGEIKENNDFRKQLYLKAKSESIGMDRISKIHCNIKELSQYFMEINNIDGKSTVVKNSYTRQSEGKFNFNVKAGLNSSSFSVSGPTNLDFGNKKTIKLGVEAEYVFPFNRNKWAIYFEPTYQTKYESEVLRKAGVNEKWKVSYNYLDLNFGLRHYMYVGPKSKLFLNASYIFSPALDAQIERNNASGDALEIVSSSSLSIGFGYNYDKKYSVEFRYGGSNILADYANVSSKFQTFSVVLGYTIFESNKK